MHRLDKITDTDDRWTSSAEKQQPFPPLKASNIADYINKTISESKMFIFSKK